MKRTYLSIYLFIAILFSFFYLYVGLTYNINVYDEGLSLFNAKRIIDGEIPYKDFWTIYSPGIFYFYSIIFSAFGESVFAVRLVTLFFLVFSAFLIFQLSFKLGSWWSALISMVIFVIFSAMFSFSGKAYFLAFVFILISVLYIVSSEQNGKKLDIFIAGISAGIVFLFRYDFFAYLMLSVFIYLLIKFFFEKKQSQKATFTKFVLYLAGSLSIILPVVIYFLANVDINTLYSTFVEFPLKIYSEYRAITPPFLLNIDKVFYSSSFLGALKVLWEGIVFYLPLALVIFFLAYKKMWQIDVFFREEKNSLTLLLCILIIIFYNVALIRFDIEHFFISVSFSIIVLSILLNDYYKRKRIVLVLSLLLCFFVSLPIAKKINFIGQAFRIEENYYFRAEKLKGISAPKDFAENYDKVIKYVNELTGKNDYIFVGNTRHDLIFVNDIMLYFVADRRSATRYSELHPGVATTKEVQKEIIDDLQKKKVRFIVLCEIKPSMEQNLSSVSSNVYELDNYIKENYVLAFNFGSYNIYKRKEQKYD